MSDEQSPRPERKAKAGGRAGRARNKQSGKGSGGGGGPFGRFVGDGDLRLIVLTLLADSPRHGYDLIKAMEERSNGFYSPSPGVIYPTLTFLEEAGHATSSAEGNKKVYATTDAGRAFLQENRAAVDAILARIKSLGERMTQARTLLEGREKGTAGGPGQEKQGKLEERERRRREKGEKGQGRDKPEAIPELSDARRALKTALTAKLGATADGQRQIATVLQRAASEINAVATPAPETTPAPQTTGGPGGP